MITIQEIFDVRFKSCKMALLSNPFFLYLKQAIFNIFKFLYRLDKLNERYQIELFEQQNTDHFNTTIQAMSDTPPNFKMLSLDISIELCNKKT